MKSISRAMSFWALAGLAALVALPALAAELRQSPKAVLELFTSQGCNSCPKADAMLSELGQREDLITLAYHVDYWDYAGWKDTFGSEANSDRQRAYGKLWGQTGVFTPQLVVNGRKGVKATKQGDVHGAIGAAQLEVPVSLAIDGGMLDIRVPSLAGGVSAVIWLVTVTGSAKVEIQNGENAGKTVEYTDIVTGKQVLGVWDTAKGAEFRLPLAELLANGSDGAVVLVQQDMNGLPGPILGAASLQL